MQAGLEPKATSRSPWAWVPTLYLAEGFPYVLVTGVSVALYKDLGATNTAVAFYTSWLGLPWVLKPLWSPVVDLLKTRRAWIWAMQFIMGIGFAAVGLALPGADFLRWTVVLFLLIAFSSATHDIAADGFYLLANTEAQQSFFSGVRNTFFRLATICAQGLLLVLVGRLEKQTGDTARAWQLAFGLAALVTLLLGVYHFFVLPRPAEDRAGREGTASKFFTDFFATFAAFFQKPKIGVMILFLLFYRFGEAQLMKMVQPFLLDPRAKGGLGLPIRELGVVYGTAGITALLAGGIVGGILVSRHGLKAWLWPMVIVMHAPDAVYIYLSQAQPQHLGIIGSCVALEQFGYGFGLTAYMMYMIYMARGKHQTAHYAICTGFMALGLMLPGMASGWVADAIGYRHFFVWVMLATLPGFLVTAIIPLEKEFGKRDTNSTN
jgi:MFS transporter, PAT family, beta-lactamase induction signal transducer AmpG